MNPTTILTSQEQFDALFANQNKAIVLYFTTTSCNVCKSIFPKLEALMQDYTNPTIKIDAEQFPDIAGQHLIFTVPTILVFFEGKEVLRESRFIDFAKIERMLDLLKN